MDEVAPGGVAGHEGSAKDFAGMIIQSKNERWITLGGPPWMRRRIVLPEFADGGALPSPPRFGAAFQGGDQMRKLLADIGGHGCAGAFEAKATLQFVSQQGEVEGLAVR